MGFKLWHSNGLQALRIGGRDSLGTVLGQHRGIGPGFDMLRMLLAVAIFYGHTNWVSGESGGQRIMAAATVVAQIAAAHGPEAHAAAADTVAGPTGGLWSTMGSNWKGIIKLSLVPTFFALSGFLVMGSAMRLKATSTFLAHRALRIFPALMMEVTLSALVLGPLVTNRDLISYFTDPAFSAYFWNIVGHVHFFLPGVFTDNPASAIVNINLWTLKPEFYSYLVMAALMMSKIAYHRAAYSALFISVTVIMAGVHYLYGYSNPTGSFPSHMMVYYFAVGVFFYHWKDAIPLRGEIFLLSAVLSFLCLADARLAYVAPWPLVYFTLFFGMLPFPKFQLLSSGDYSYGVYLYGFPIAQALVAIWPGLFRMHFELLLPVSFAVTMAFAYISWHGMEKHALAIKRSLPKTFFPTTPRERVMEVAAFTQTGRAER